MLRRHYHQRHLTVWRFLASRHHLGGPDGHNVRCEPNAVQDLVNLLDLEQIEVNIFAASRPTRTGNESSAARSPDKPW
ncbi:MAG: hypothetical protein R2706_05155 [Acidimicrobiales bacterium]